MKFHLVPLLFIGLWTTIISCSQNPSPIQVENISIDFNNIKSIDLDSASAKVILLEATEQSLLYDINRVCFLKDRIITCAKDDLCVFDGNGQFLFNVGRTGNGPGEYSSLFNFFIQDGL